MRLLWLVMAAVCQGTFPAPLLAASIVIYGFEGSTEGWVIPEWALVSSDYVGKECLNSDRSALEGKEALEVVADFPGGRWFAIYVEREIEVRDWTPFGEIAVDVYVPSQAPEGLSGRFIFTVGEQWKWTEMNRALPLVPGEWTTITAKVKPGSMDWQFFPDDAFRRDIRKIGVRIEAKEQTTYSGSVFIDNMRLSE